MFRSFHKKFCILFAISLIIFLTSGSHANADTWDVYPTMTRLDIQAVVNSASDGDTIYFHPGFYDWSDAPLRVKEYNEGAITIIEKSLILKGVSGTLIFGPNSINGTSKNAQGANAFHVIDLDIDNDVTFDNLNFENFLRGISIHYITLIPGGYIAEPNARNITVKNCTFSDIHRDAISTSNVRGNILIQDNYMSVARVGMFIDWYNSENHADWQAEDKHVQILGNEIYSLYRGVYLSMTTNVAIKRNEIDCQNFGIFNNYARKGTVIAENSLFNCSRGIFISGRWIKGIKYEAEGAVIERNKLIDISYYGVYIAGDASFGHTVSKNEIQMAPGSHVGIYTVAHDSYYGQNKISGSGRFAFLLDERKYSGLFVYAHHITLQANNVNQFSPLYIHFYLYSGTHDNLIVGSGMGHNTYLDYGYNNRITGAMPMTGGIGQDLSEAVKERNEELQEAGMIKF